MKALTQHLPSKPSNKAQRNLAKKHGTPREFAEAVLAALGEISVSEADAAIARYLTQWNEAATPPRP